MKANKVHSFWLVVVLLTGLVLVLGSGRVSYAAPEQALEEAANADVVLIIDRSETMRESDPDNKRLDGARAFLTAAVAGDQVAVVEFASGAGLLSPLVPLPENREALFPIIGAIESSGFTDFGKGIQTACEELQTIRATNEIKMAILITDGFNDPNPYENQHECFETNGWPIYIFGIGEANDELLSQIAEDTDGAYKNVPVSNLVCEYQAIRSKVAGSTPPACTTRTVNPEETTEITVNLTRNFLQATFSIAWPGSDVVMSLTSPTGRVIERSTEADDITHDVDAALETYSITMPETGEWVVSLFGADVAEGGTEVVFGYGVIPDPADPSEPPLPPQDFAASDGEKINEVTLSWTLSEGATYYEVYRSTAAGRNEDPWELIATVDGDTNTAADNENVDGTVVFYTAKACSEVGCSDYAEVDQGSAAMPSLNDIFNPEMGTDYTITWEPAQTATRHELQERYEGGEWDTIYSGVMNSIDRDDRDEGEWCYRVRAYNPTQGDSPWTFEKCTTVVIPLPGVYTIFMPVLTGNP